ncbi:MAG: hypothetical protein AAF668_10600 [Pseudomonadota bacterium]
MLNLAVSGVDTFDFTVQDFLDLSKSPTDALAILLVYGFVIKEAFTFICRIRNE